MLKKCLCVAACLLLLGICPASFGGNIDEEGTKVKFSGYMGFETSEIMSGRFRQYLVDHRWGGTSIGSLTADALLNDRARLLLSLEGIWSLANYPTEIATSAKQQGLQNYASFTLYQAQAIISIINQDDLSLDFSFGIIPYKYNPEVRNLGEYLFRSICYPGIIFNNFDFPMDRLSGLRLNFKQHSSIGDLSADAFVLSERSVRPFSDISLAAIVDYNLMRAIDIGLGVNLYRVISVNSEFTTPHSTQSFYDLNGGDSLFYTFAGTKVMARTTIDPLFFMRESDFGRLLGEGGKIYGEVDILGLKNYPRNDTARKMPDGTPYSGDNIFGYDSLMNKMPLTFGINIPAPFVFDICAVEFEYYQMRYPNCFVYVFEDGLPIPQKNGYINSSFGDPENAYSVSDNWKWSVYVKRNISKNFRVVAQASRDHQRWKIPGFIWDKWADWDDICHRPNNWIWNLKGEVSF